MNPGAVWQEAREELANPTQSPCSGELHYAAFERAILRELTRASGQVERHRCNIMIGRRGRMFSDEDLPPHSESAKEQEALATGPTEVAWDNEGQRRTVQEPPPASLTEVEWQRALKFQRMYLPADDVIIGDYDIAGYSRPCRDFGGDYYDFVSYEDGRIAFVIGDVSGKGFQAALQASKLKEAVHSMVKAGADAASAVAGLNRSQAAIEAGRYATLFFGVLSPTTGVFRFCNAGHNAPILVRRGKRTGEPELGTSGTPVWLFAEPSEYQLCEIGLESKDFLALITDGVLEVNNHKGEFFGEERLVEFLCANADRSCATVARELYLHVLDWAGSSGDVSDDFTIVLIRRHGRG